jgi:hypothetical protein
MGIYSTLNVSRRTAIDTVAAQLELDLQRVRAGEISDDELTQHLDIILEPQLNNARIVNDGEPNDDDRVPVPGI